MPCYHEPTSFTTPTIQNDISAVDASIFSVDNGGDNNSTESNVIYANFYSRYDDGARSVVYGRVTKAEMPTNPWDPIRWIGDPHGHIIYKNDLIDYHRDDKGNTIFDREKNIDNRSF